MKIALLLLAFALACATAQDFVYDCHTKEGTQYMPSGENVSYPVQWHIGQMFELFGHCDCAALRRIIGNPYLTFSQGIYSDDPSRCDCAVEQVDYHAPPGAPADWYAESEFNPFTEIYLLPLAICNYPECPSAGAEWPALLVIPGGYVTADYYQKTISQELPTGDAIYTFLWNWNHRSVARFDMDRSDPHKYELRLKAGRHEQLLYMHIDMPEDVVGDIDGIFPTMNQYGFTSFSTYQSNQTIIHDWNPDTDIWHPSHNTYWHESDFTPVQVYSLLRGSEDDCCFWPMPSFEPF